jgi:hypothetical protein
MVWVAGRAPTSGYAYRVAAGGRAAKCQMAGFHPDLWRHTASRRRRYATGKGR